MSKTFHNEGNSLLLLWNLFGMFFIFFKTMTCNRNCSIQYILYCTFTMSDRRILSILSEINALLISAYRNRSRVIRSSVLDTLCGLYSLCITKMNSHSNAFEKLRDYLWIMMIRLKNINYKYLFFQLRYNPYDIMNYEWQFFFLIAMPI